MGILKALPLPISLPASPAYAREQLGEKIQALENN